MSKIKVIILANEIKNDHALWVRACEDYKAKVEYRIVNLTFNNWLEEIQKANCDFLLAKPGGQTNPFKNLYDERISILVKELDYKVFPSFTELMIYENKKYLSYWLKANKLPHPRTEVFYHLKEALRFIETAKLPIVTKLNIGASANGVRIFKNKNKLISYTNRLFRKGQHSRTGPKLDKGKLFHRLYNKIVHPEAILERLRVYRSIAEDKQSAFIIFQEFIPHNFEWRAVRIGDSYFAHKKMKKGELASGSLIKDYDTPPFSLLDFVKQITDKFGFYSVAIDLFEITDDKFLINEIQCIFGQSDPYQMKIDEKPGRFIWYKGTWVFEEGMFNKNESYNSRIETIISHFDEKS